MDFDKSKCNDIHMDIKNIGTQNIGIKTTKIANVNKKTSFNKCYVRTS